MVEDAPADTTPLLKQYKHDAPVHSSRHVHVLVVTTVAIATLLAVLLLMDRPLSLGGGSDSSLGDPWRSLAPLGTLDGADSAQRLEITRLGDKFPVTLIHVGKTGGESVNFGLRDIFSDYKVIHLTHVVPSDLKDRTVFFPIRDPVSRFESAYKWRKHESSASGFAIEREIFECYPTLADFGSHCLEETACAETLQHELQTNQSVHHLGMGLQYYTENFDYQHVPMYITQAESLQDDFDRAVSHLLGVDVSFPLQHANADYAEKDDWIPEEFKANVRQLLQGEYVVYDKIKEIYSL
jgi:hypothetical protein